jgi:hypothetical protein
MLLLDYYIIANGIIYTRKKTFFINHAVFKIHFHCFLFLLYCITLPFSMFLNTTIPSLIQLVGPVVYLWFGMYNVYKQSKFKTTTKLLLLTAFYGLFLAIGVLINSIMSVNSLN